jgi:hypothetical protein
VADVRFLSVHRPITAGTSNDWKFAQAAASSTRSIRLRRREAVSGFSFQSGFKIASTSSMVILAAGSRRRRGVVPQGHLPLRGVVAVAPGGAHALDQAVGAFTERSAY